MRQRPWRPQQRQPAPTSPWPLGGDVVRGVPPPHNRGRRNHVSVPLGKTRPKGGATRRRRSIASHRGRESPSRDNGDGNSQGRERSGPRGTSTRQSTSPDHGPRPPPSAATPEPAAPLLARECRSRVGGDNSAPPRRPCPRRQRGGAGAPPPPPLSFFFVLSPLMSSSPCPLPRCRIHQLVPWDCRVSEQRHIGPLIVVPLPRCNRELQVVVP